MDKIVLNNGFEIPRMGFGTYPQKETLPESARIASAAGYSLFDISDNYNNEEFLGRAVAGGFCGAEGDVVVSKFSQAFRTRRLRRCFEESRAKLSGKLDVYLLHWPYPFLWKAQWRRMEKLYLAGKCRAIGVCNFEVPKLKELLAFARVKPAINQIERHPLFQQNEIADFCKANGIQVMAYSPLGRQDAEMFGQEVLRDLAKKHSKSVGQIVLRWNVDTGVIPIPGSKSPEHIRENADIFDFSLTKEEIERINGLDAGKRIRFDPKTRFSWKRKVRFFVTRILLPFLPGD